jgi:beta-mannosidase
MNSLKDINLLNGSWRYVTDANDKLTYAKAVASLRKKNAKEMKVPVNWELAGLHNFSGSVWFAKTFNLKFISDKLNILEFKGVDYFADVWLNNSYLGNHEGYFQSFYFDVSELLNKNGNNFFVVKVNSPKEEAGESLPASRQVWPLKKKLIKGIFNHHDCRPGAWSYKYGQDQNTGGIWNDILLHSVDELFVESVIVTAKINFVDNMTLIKVTINYCKRKKSFLKDKIEIIITSPSGKKLKLNKEIHLNYVEGKISFVAEVAKPALWWSWDLGKPNLYRLNILGKYVNVENLFFGIREVKLNKKKEFFLNGKKLFLRGTNVIPTQFLSELKQRKISEQVTAIRGANINILRMHAHVNRKEYYDECDKQGILVWQDFALQWTYNSSNNFAENAASQIKDMVKLHYNHPSVAFWCCHNEPGEQINTLDPLLYKSVLEIDKSRIVRLASNYEEHPYDGWYWGNKEHFAAKPMGPLVTEFGAQALPELNSLKRFIPKKDLFDPIKESWAYHDFQYEQTFNIAEVDRGKNVKEFISNSQSYQSELLHTAIDFYRRGKNIDIAGIFQFMFIDCWPSITWSVVDYYGKKKKGYFTLQKAFQPLYVSVSIRIKKYFSGQRLNIDYWIINDYHKQFNSCKIIFRIDKKIIGDFPVKKILEDSITHFNWETNEIKLPIKMKTGKYKVEAELIQNKKIISKNDFEIEIVKKK